MSTEADLVDPARQPSAEPARAFDITPTDEQRMLVDAVREFRAEAGAPGGAAGRRRAAAPRPSCWRTAAELGLTAIGVPEALGGVLEHRATVTAALDRRGARRGRHGHRRSPASRRPGSRPRSDCGATPTSRPPICRAFVGDAPPAAAIAIAEPRALFDPFALQTRARRTGG